MTGRKGPCGSTDEGHLTQCGWGGWSEMRREQCCQRQEGVKLGNLLSPFAWDCPGVSNESPGSWEDPSAR